ncbi:MarR family transcriptional regulator [Rhizobium sp. AG855]|nr:MarR family transcriptional regulator [Rhizobium sp. AG855]
MTSKTDQPERPAPIFPFNDKDQMENYLPYQLNRLAREWSTIQGQVLQAHGWTEPMLRIMSSLHAHGQMTVNEVAALSLIEQSGASRVIETLVNAGHVVRKISDKDQRVRTVALTSRGRKKLQEIAPAINGIYSQFVSQLQPDELRACVCGLQKLHTRIASNEAAGEDRVA